MNPKTWQNKLNQADFESLKEFLWPIRWQIFRPSRNLFLAFWETKRFLRLALVIVLIGFLGSFYFLSLGVFVLTTKEVADNGGTFYESVLQTNLTHLNPVLEPTGDMETKIIDLLYEPLYRVKLPDFLQSKKIEITPVLLTKEPTWQDLENPNPQERYKILRFSLRENLKWSDGSSLNLRDIRYTFERLKEPSGNSQFRQSLENVEMVSLGNNEFDLRASSSSPQLIFGANFVPISETYFASSKNDQIQAGKNFNGVVTSGPMILPINYTDNLQTKPNPTILPTGRFDKLILNKNPNSLGRKVFLDKIVFQNSETLEETNNKSLESAAKTETLDLFSRFLPSSSLKSEQVLEKLNPKKENSKYSINQKIVPTNIYYSIFLNLKKSNDGYFINQNLRRYLICSLLNWQNSKLDSYLEKIPKNRQVLPVQLNTETIPDCPSSQEEIENNLKEALSLDKLKIYSFGKDKEVLIFGKPFELKMATTLDLENPLLQEVVQFFKTIGLPLKIVNDSSQIKNILESQNKDFNLSFLPLNITASDPYPLLGLKGKDLLQTSLNERVKDYNFEDNLKKYSESNFGDQNSLKILTDFFGKEFAMFNLGRGLQEINYSNRIQKLDFENLGIYNFGSDLYQKLPEWHWQTKRVF